MSLPEQPDGSVVAHHPRKTLSKVAGVGAGTALVVWAKELGFSPGFTGFLEACAPAFAVGLSWVGPYVTWIVVHNVRYFGYCFIRRRARGHLNNLIPGTPTYELAQRNVDRLEHLIAKLISEATSSFDDFRW